MIYIILTITDAQTIRFSSFKVSYRNNDEYLNESSERSNVFSSAGLAISLLCEAGTVLDIIRADLVTQCVLIAILTNSS